MNDFQSIFKSFANIKVGVIGDVMLDTYMWGKVERISHRRRCQRGFEPCEPASPCDHAERVRQ
jgi:hypothetical protein